MSAESPVEPFSTCHSDEVAEWVKKHDKLRLAGKEKNDE